MCTATSPQDVHNDSCIEGQATEESHHGIAVLGMEQSESVSAAAAGRETLILNSDEEEPAIAEPQQESSQQETQPGSSKPSESVLPRNVPPIGVAIVAGVFMFCCTTLALSTLFVMRCIYIFVHVLQNKHWGNTIIPSLHVIIYI